MIRRSHAAAAAEVFDWAHDALPLASWIALIALFLLHVLTHGSGASSMLTLVFFAALALNA
jgi:hypothetical protein